MMHSDINTSASAGKWQRFLRKFHSFANLALLVLFLFMVNLVCVKVDSDIMFPGEAQRLSPRTTEMLGGLAGKIKCTVLLPENNIYYSPLRTLLLNIRRAMTGAEMDIDFVDPHSSPSQAAVSVGKYGSAEWVVAFEKNGRIEKITLDDLLETAAPRAPGDISKPPSAARFVGEQVCVTSLARLANPRRPVVLAVSGHGERDFSDYDLVNGYSDFARELVREGYSLRTVTLDAPLPEECDMLLVAGPRTPPLPSEKDVILSYIRNGGRLLMLLDRSDAVPSGWEEILEALGLEAANLTAVNQKTPRTYSLLVDKFGTHPVTKDLGNSAVYFINPQVFDFRAPASSGAQIKTEIIADAPATAWGETNPDEQSVRFDQGVDRENNLHIAVAVEISGAEDLGLAVSRAVVIGDSDFGANSLMAGGRTANRDILLNAVNWLTDNGRATSPSNPAVGNALRLGISRVRQLRFWCFSVLGWPLLTVILGFVMAKVRKMTI